MKYPALDVDRLDPDFLLALVDEFNPTAVENHDSRTTVFFPDSLCRDRAREAIIQAHPDATVVAREVDDEDWARRSQHNLAPITVGRITVAPPWAISTAESSAGARLTILIQPSMGFGTGHHATTRLCLRALQELDLTGRRGLDVGTGSGVLAIAMRMLGAAEVVGIDDDADAIQSANESLTANPGVDRVRFQTIDLRSAPLPKADVVTANLTGALLIQTAALLVGALTADGSLIVSGLQRHERDAVVDAFGTARLTWEAVEDEWVAAIFRP